MKQGIDDDDDDNKNAIVLAAAKLTSILCGYMCIYISQYSLCLWKPIILVLYNKMSHFSNNAFSMALHIMIIDI
jgi:hypothetical protein